MATNFIQEGDTLTLTLPADTDAVPLTSGTGIQIGNIFGVGIKDGVEGDDVAIKVTGVWTLPKVSAQAWVVGDKIYWDDVAGNCTTTSTGTLYIGWAVATAANPSATGRVRLNPGGA